jgi:hypothetical protein
MGRLNDPHSDAESFYRRSFVFESLADARKCFNDYLLVIVCYYDILGNYGSGYEVVTCLPSRTMALEEFKNYLANEPGTRFKIRLSKEVHNA